MTTPVTISVDSDAAQALAGVSPEERRKIEVLLSLRLRELTAKPRRTLAEVMDEIGQEAERAGLTEEKLAELLNGQ